MIFTSFLIFALTILVIFYPLVRSKSAQPEVSLQDIYKKNYIATEERLSKELASGALTQEQYELQKAEAARDLLKISRQNVVKLSAPTRIIVTLIALLFPILAIGGFWALSYTPDVRLYDSERTRLVQEFTEWRDTIPSAELNSPKSILEVEPQPRNPEIFNELKYGFPALFFMSAKETHDNPTTLKLLGKMLYDVRWLPAAHEVYSRVIELSPNDYIANTMIIDIELQNSQNQLTPALIKKIEAFLALNPEDTGLRVMYAQALYDNQMIDEAIVQWQNLRKIFAERNTTPEQKEQSEKTVQAIDMILAAINQQTMETAQIRNYVINTKSLDALNWESLSDPSLLTVYMMDLEENTPLAYKEILITPNSNIPDEISINDFDSFEGIAQPIRNYEHIAVFGDIKNLKNNSTIYTTPLVQLPKGAYESALLFEPKDDVEPFANNMNVLVDLVAKQQDKRFLVQVNAPDVDLEALPNAATLNLFISMAGSRMPLAAKKIPAAKTLSFPLTVEITDTDKLMPNSPSLFSYDNLEIGGRLSMTNEAVGTAGDIESIKEAIPTAKINIITLDQIRDSSKASPIKPN